MLLTTHSRQDANTLVTLFDNTTPKSLGMNIQSSQNSQPEQNQKLPNLSARLVKDISVEFSRKQKCRLIIRNLSFQAIEENILQKFRKFGPITEVNIPKVTVTAKPNKKQQQQHGGKGNKGNNESMEKAKPRGFGFVTFLCENDAQSVVNGGCDGMKICNREFAVDFCLNRHAHEWELKRSEDEGKDGENVKVNEENKSNSNENENEDKDENDENDDMEESEEDEVEEEEEDDDNEEDEENEDEDDEEENDEEKKENNEKSQQDALVDVNEGRTIFVR